MRPGEFGREADGGSRSDRTSIPNLLIRSGSEFEIEVLDDHRAFCHGRLWGL